MNGKITAKRRQERSDHRLQVRLRTPGLVRPGAAMETWPEALRYRGVKCMPFGMNLGGTAGYSSSLLWGGLFLLLQKRTIQV